MPYTEGTFHCSPLFAGLCVTCPLHNAKELQVSRAE